VSGGNFERAVARMQQRGCRPFTPDGPSNVRSARWLPATASELATASALAAPADRIDALIAAFAVGVLLGMLIP
jgi:hypothetical protein